MILIHQPMYNRWNVPELPERSTRQRRATMIILQTSNKVTRVLFIFNKLYTSDYLDNINYVIIKNTASGIPNLFMCM